MSGWHDGGWRGKKLKAKTLQRARAANCRRVYGYAGLRVKPGTARKAGDGARRDAGIQPTTGMDAESDTRRIDECGKTSRIG
ncbi:hypothetical protein [Burkholderia diffusa]|uniref:hypothetical protein n=1 Tax=Burkholderia diffusa TaxID=488732 RepID=UPI0012D93608|nr:hypothetical protein [Burkholderia diffusa]